LDVVPGISGAGRSLTRREVPGTPGATAATASAVAKSIGLDEVVEYLRDPDRVAFYGMMNILPATPIRWTLENVDPANSHLHCGLARWYRRPLIASLG
jgi:hypothetical protein